jgi:hypothetical protein
MAAARRGQNARVFGRAEARSEFVDHVGLSAVRRPSLAEVPAQRLLHGAEGRIR